MIRTFLKGALVGALVPMFWGVLGFLFWGAHNSWLTDLFWDAVYVTCPPWMLPITGDAGLWVTPLLSGLLYGIIFVAVGILRRTLKTARGV